MRMQASRMMWEGLILGVLSFAGLYAVSAQGRSLASKPKSAPHDFATTEPVRAAPVLLELFTSEGCSSCPPADALLMRLEGTKTNSGQMLIGLSEHVTYWNDLGWHDPYSDDLFTQRQNSYNNRFNLDSVYTPQLVINGAEQVVGSDARGVARALQAEEQKASQQPVRLQIEFARKVPNGLAVTYTLSAPGPDAHAELYAAVADDVDRSTVLRGENGGRTLQHAAVVRSLVYVGPAQAAADQQIVIRVPAAVLANGVRQHLVLFAQEVNFGPVLGVAEQPLTQ